VLTILYCVSQEEMFLIVLLCMTFTPSVLNEERVSSYLLLASAVEPLVVKVSHTACAMLLEIYTPFFLWVGRNF